MVVSELVGLAALEKVVALHVLGTPCVFDIKVVGDVSTDVASVHTTWYRFEVLSPITKVFGIDHAFVKVHPPIIMSVLDVCNTGSLVDDNLAMDLLQSQL